MHHTGIQKDGRVVSCLIDRDSEILGVSSKRAAVQTGKQMLCVLHRHHRRDVPVCDTIHAHTCFLHQLQTDDQIPPFCPPLTQTQKEQKIPTVLRRESRTTLFTPSAPISKSNAMEPWSPMATVLELKSTPSQGVPKSSFSWGPAYLSSKF